MHRAIRSLIRSNKKIGGVHRVEGVTELPRQSIYPYEQPRLDETGTHLSVTERRADEATRDVVNWLKCEYLMDRVGEEYSGVVSAVTGFGLFVMLDDLYVEGLIHVTGLPKDYYYHESAQHRMVGERTGRVFRLGDKVRVRVAQVILDERKIDFELAEQSSLSDKPVEKKPAKVTVSSKARAMADEYEAKRKAKANKKGKKKAGKTASKKKPGKLSKRRRNAAPEGPKSKGKKRGSSSGKRKSKR